MAVRVIRFTVTAGSGRLALPEGVRLIGVSSDAAIITALSYSALGEGHAVPVTDNQYWEPHYPYLTGATAAVEYTTSAAGVLSVLYEV